MNLPAKPFFLGEALILFRDGTQLECTITEATSQDRSAHPRPEVRFEFKATVSQEQAMRQHIRQTEEFKAMVAYLLGRGGGLHPSDLMPSPMMVVDGVIVDD